MTAWRLPGNNNIFLLTIPLLARLYAAIGRRRALQRIELAASGSAEG